ncbi:MAG TPA: hypothetical protein ACFYEK_05455 [Candidatus Wunengus sp. YC60]|uniref:hypothetical protein n=1 Tax=Candidatus Wunengus sp. YC60 TaxID=3367697 RepID=UPI004026414A
MTRINKVATIPPQIIMREDNILVLKSDSSLPPRQNDGICRSEAKPKNLMFQEHQTLYSTQDDRYKDIIIGTHNHTLHV